MNERLHTALKRLHLSGLTQALDVRLQEASSHQLSHAEFLELVLQDELLVREQRPCTTAYRASSEIRPEGL